MDISEIRLELEWGKSFLKMEDRDTCFSDKLQKTQLRIRMNVNLNIRFALWASSYTNKVLKNACVGSAARVVQRQRLKTINGQKHEPNL